MNDGITSGSRFMVDLLPWGGGAARSFQGSRGCRDSLERDRRSLGFLLMAPLGDGAAEMVTR
jgi:hypothetical protein